MSMFDKHMMLPKTLTDYVEARDNIADKMRRAYMLLDEADKLNHETLSEGMYYETSPPIKVERAINELDKRFWRKAFDLTGCMKIMDHEARVKFFDSLEKECPHFSIENIQSTFITFAQDADSMFKRGVYNVFRQLPSGYRTNDKEPFKVDRRCILGWMCESWSGLRVRYEKSDMINDIDRVFKIIDEQEHIPRSLEYAINAAFTESNIYDDDYYHIKGFKNGNMHIMFKRPDLLEKANKLISEYCGGNALAESNAA